MFGAQAGCQLCCLVCIAHMTACSHDALLPCRYARAKFLAASGLTESSTAAQVADALPRTRAFLAGIAGLQTHPACLLPGCRSLAGHSHFLSSAPIDHEPVKHGLTPLLRVQLRAGGFPGWRPACQRPPMQPRAPRCRWCPCRCTPASGPSGPAQTRQQPAPQQPSWRLASLHAAGGAWCATSP